MNKREHIINGMLIGIGVGVLVDYATPGAALRSVVGVAVPVTLGALVPDVDTEFGIHRKTLHNVFILGGFIAFPVFYSNLEYVWIGVLSHFLLDAFGSKQGIALWYPFSDDEWNPLRAVSVSSRFAGVVTALITVFEMAIAAVIILGTTQYGGALPL